MTEKFQQRASERRNPGPLAHPSAPALRLPAGVVDAHCHIFGPTSRFPFAADAPFTPPESPVEALAARHRHLGIERCVIVQSLAHGRDHSALLAALDQDRSTRRGVALLEPDPDRAEAAELAGEGVVGARLHFVPQLSSAATREQADRLARIAAELGWHVEVHLEGEGIVEHGDMLADLPAPVVIDHMGGIDLSEGIACRALDALRTLLDREHVWVKISGVDRLSFLGPPWQDATDLAALLVAQYPERVLWGTDFPHVGIVGTAPDDGLLVDVLATVAPDEPTRHRLLVDNPNSVFGF